MKPILLSLFNHPILQSVAHHLALDIANITYREFPDKEIYIRMQDVLQDRDVIILDSLDRPNDKLLPLLFVAKTAKELGARRVGLCATYLPYMRQDKQFNPGEGITSKYFAEIISKNFDWLITIDPHLHRRHNLSEIYTIPSCVLHVAPLVSSWIKTNIDHPVLIGPDSESEQWVAVIAEAIQVPYLILEKIRHGDNDVEVSSFNPQSYLNHTPVLVDDIISTAHTILETIKQLKAAKMKPAVCIGVHAIFANDAYTALQEAWVDLIVTCNSVPHVSNQIDTTEIICNGIQQITLNFDTNK